MFKKYLLITDSLNKNYLLSKIDELDVFYNVKIITLDEIINNISFKSSKQIELELYNSYNYPLDVINEIIKVFKYIDINKKYLSNKLNTISKIYKEIIDKFNFDNSKYINYYNGFDEIVLYNLDEEKQEVKLLHKKINKPFKFINNTIKKVDLNIHKYETFEEELNATFYTIANLIYEGKDINKIHIVNVSSDDDYLISKYASLYNIPVNGLFNNKLIDFPVATSYLNHLKRTSFKHALELLDEENTLNEKYIKLRKAIIDIVNEYVVFNDHSSIYKFIENDFKKKNIKGIVYEKAVDILSIDEVRNNDDYYFVLGVNYNHAPNIYKDDGYFNNQELQELEMNTSIQKTKLSEKRWCEVLTNTQNIFLSYRLKNSFESFYPSDLISKLKITTLDKEELNNISYSKDLDNYLVKLELENNSTLDEPLINRYYSSYLSSYKEYDNSFKGNKAQIINDLKEKLSLSYSSLDSYNKCAFQYYLKYVLKLDKFEATIFTNIGNVFHIILKKCFDKDFDFEKVYEEESSKYKSSYKEIYYFNKLKKELALDIEFIKDFRAVSHLKNAFHELEISLDNQINNLSYKFKGIIDKIMYQKIDDTTIASIIDYKTGSLNLDKSLFEYGLSLQLPTYLYLLRKSNILENLKFAGFYLQKIINKNESEQIKDKKSLLKLEGFTTIDINVLKEFDPTYQESFFLKGIKIKKDGSFLSKDRMMSNEEIEELIDLCEKKINEVAANILNANFTINPKIIKNENISCKYCKFKDICFKTNKNLLALK